MVEGLTGYRLQGTVKLMKKTARHGFTLVELLVVVSIIAVLSTIGITMYSSAQRLARDAKRRADLQSIQQALELYNSINGYYPKTAGWVYSDSASDPWLTGMDTNYMSRLPKDPQNIGGHPYSGGYTYGYYTATLSGQGTEGGYYMLLAHLEAPNSDDLTTKCVLPEGDSFGSTNSGAATIYANNIFFCNRR